jgi:sec-independent protein translocase protein TatA
MPFGVPELLLVLVIILLLFGVGRISKIAGELGSGIRAFRDGLNPDDKDEKDSSDQETPSSKTSDEA